MKMKNYLKATFLLAAIISVWLLLQNIEALASGEEPSHARCYGPGSVDCPINHDKVEIVYEGFSVGE